MPHRIQPGLRYTLAQLALRLIFGRKHHYIAPWEMSAVGTAACLVSPDGKRAIVQQRAGNIEGVGKYGTFGGYLELKDRETFAQALVREFYEETLLHVDPTNFEGMPNALNILYGQEKIVMTNHTGVGLWFFRTVPDDFHTHLQTSEEVAAYRWVTLPEWDQMWENNQIQGAITEHYGKVRQALVEAETRRYPLLKFTQA